MFDESLDGRLQFALVQEPAVVLVDFLERFRQQLLNLLLLCVAHFSCSTLSGSYKYDSTSIRQPFYSNNNNNNNKLCGRPP